MITDEVAFIAIAVSNKERAREFYQETLELKPTRTQMDGAWVEYDLGPITTCARILPGDTRTQANAHSDGWRMGRV